MTAPPISTRTRQRLVRLGVTGSALEVFHRWLDRAGYHDTLDRLSDEALAGRVASFAETTTGSASLALACPTPPPPPATGRRMDPATAHRMVEEGAARHRARLLAEQVAREVIAERLRTPRLSEVCPKCTTQTRCWEHAT